MGNSSKPFVAAPGAGAAASALTAPRASSDAIKTNNPFLNALLITKTSRKFF
jgi:hypothetical protein